jgi:hypothetical protein
MNVLYHENVVPPLDKGRDIANPKNDREWLIIPMIFNPPKERLNIEGKKCLTYDVYLNTAVVVRMKEEARAMRSITNYLILKFQEYIDDSFVIHKKTVKHLKKRRYKCPKGTESQRVLPFVLPKEHDLRHFKAVKEKLLKEKKEEEKKMGLKKEEIKLTAPVAPDQEKESTIKIPG